MSAQSNTFIFYGKVALAAPTLKWDDFWIQIKDFWLEITKKIGQPAYFILPLDLESLSAGYSETNVQNSICIVTSHILGSAKNYLQSTNRFDIIQLYHAIQYGENLMKASLQKGQILRSTEFDCETITSFFGFGKTKLHLSASPSGFEFSGNKASNSYEIDKIQAVFSKYNDSNSETRLCINVVENGSTVTKEFNCISKQNLVNAILCFLYNSYLYRATAATNATNPVIDV